MINASDQEEDYEDINVRLLNLDRGGIKNSSKSPKNKTKSGTNAWMKRYAEIKEKENVTSQVNDSNVDYNELHEKLISRILMEEEDVLREHKGHIDLMFNSSKMVREKNLTYKSRKHRCLKR
jgi:hypothetical protein